jgi:membrane protease YdiL (CAAX protease family)
MTWPTLSALGYFVALASQGGPSVEPNLASQICYFGTKAVQFSLPVVWLGLIQGQKLRPGEVHLRGLELGLGFGLLVAGAILALYFGWLRDTSHFHSLALKLRAKLEDFGAATPARFILLGAFMTLIHSLLEEYYWRWFVFGELKRLIPVGAAIVISGFAFMAHHVVVLASYMANVPLIVVLSLGVAVGGIVWAWIYHRAGSIWSVWLSHLLIDAAIMTIGYDAVFSL